MSGIRTPVHDALLGHDCSNFVQFPPLRQCNTSSPPTLSFLRPLTTTSFALVLVNILIKSIFVFRHYNRNLSWWSSTTVCWHHLSCVCFGFCWRLRYLEVSNFRNLISKKRYPNKNSIRFAIRWFRYLKIKKVQYGTME